jgi:hypothetical protein
MKSLKQLIKQEEDGNAARYAEVRCFAINNFGNGQHAFADADNLALFKAPYVRECLLKMADSVHVRDNFRALAKELAG